MPVYLNQSKIPAASEALATQQSALLKTLNDPSLRAALIEKGLLNYIAGINAKGHLVASTPEESTTPLDSLQLSKLFQNLQVKVIIPPRLEYCVYAGPLSDPQRTQASKDQKITIEYSSSDVIRHNRALASQFSHLLRINTTTKRISVDKEAVQSLNFDKKTESTQRLIQILERDASDKSDVAVSKVESTQRFMQKILDRSKLHKDDVTVSHPSSSSSKNKAATKIEGTETANNAPQQYHNLQGVHFISETTLTSFNMITWNTLLTLMESSKVNS